MRGGGREGNKRMVRMKTPFRSHILLLRNLQDAAGGRSNERLECFVQQSFLPSK